MIIKFIIYIIGFFLLLSLLFGGSTVLLILRLLFGKRKKRKQEESKNKPESQSDRIITYKKKEFEKSDAEDVEFEEIKDD